MDGVVTKGVTEDGRKLDEGVYVMVATAAAPRAARPIEYRLQPWEPHRRGGPVTCDGSPANLLA